MNRQQQPPNYGAVSTSDVAIRSDRSMDFNSLCDNAVTNIYTINQSWKELDNALKAIGTARDNQGLRNKIHVTQLSANQIASATSKDICRLKLLQSKGDKQQQLQVEKLEENFKEAVSRYHAVQKEVASKQKAHLLVSVSIESTAAEENVDQQKQAQLAREMAFEQDMMLEREARIRQIETDVLDVNQIMRELGALVHEQGETIDTIENSIDHAAGNVEEGHEQLIKASQYQNKYRKKLFIVAVIGLVIAVILIVILVVELKKK